MFEKRSWHGHSCLDFIYCYIDTNIINIHKLTVLLSNNLYKKNLKTFLSIDLNSLKYIMKLSF